MGNALLMRRRAILRGGWNPSKLGGLVAYWNADDIVGASGAAVPSWTDRSAGITVSQATGTAQPTLVTNAGSTGHKGVRFTSASSQFLAGARGSLPAQGPLWVWAVHLPVSLPTQWGVAAVETPANASVGWAAWYQSNNLAYINTWGKWQQSAGFGFGLNPAGGTTATGVPYWQRWEWDGTTVTGSNFNGYPATTATQTTQAAAGATTVTIGAVQKNATPQFFSDATVMLVLIGTTPPAASDRAKFSAWLWENYGILSGIERQATSFAATPGISNTGTATTDAIELSVIYNASAIFGHKYWLAFAPIAAGVASENPNINYSDDGNTWSQTGLHTNPTVNAPTTGNNADPTLFDNTARDGRLYLYRTVEAGSPNGVFAQSTTDPTGAWTNHGQLIGTTNYECPVVCYDSGSSQYWLYTMNIHPGFVGAPTVYRQTASSPVSTSWSTQVACTINAPHGIVPWHTSSPIKIGGRWVMAFSGTQNNSSTGVFSLWLASSTDGLTWTAGNDPLLVTGANANWDAYSPYRPAIQDAGDGSNLLLWYTGGAAYVSPGGSGHTNQMSQMMSVSQALIP